LLSENYYINDNVDVLLFVKYLKKVKLQPDARKTTTTHTILLSRFLLENINHGYVIKTI